MLFAIWFSFGFWLFHRYEHMIVRWFGWILIPFGNNSLYVYIIHAFVLFFAHLIMWHASSNILINLIGSFVIVGLIWLSVRHKFLMKIIPR
ncbi:OpgC protein [compost metagenome]